MKRRVLGGGRLTEGGGAVSDGSLRGAPGMVWRKPALEYDREIHVLMVEDSRADAVLARIALEAAGIPFRLSTLKRGDALLAWLHAVRQTCPEDLPDLIMLDLGLPGVDGFELLAELSRLPPALRAVPIVLLTAHLDFGYICETYPLCVMAYITKPCSSAELKAVLHRVQRWRLCHAVAL